MRAADTTKRAAARAADITKKAAEDAANEHIWTIIQAHDLW